MTFEETLGHVRDLLQRKQRVSYRALKRQFALDDDYLEDLKAELIKAERVAADEDGDVLVWIGGGSPESSVQGPGSERIQSLKPALPAPVPQAQVSPVEGAKVQSLEIQPPIPNPQPQAAERRQLTVMFCDLVGSTALSAQLDPEELRDVVRAYQQTSAAVIERFGGHIAQYLGDGLLVYFGYPVAHEDDATRAVRTGLAVLQVLRDHAIKNGDQGNRTSLHVRIGIHTGLVVVGEMGGGSRQEQLALGETPNIAARVQGQAQPDEVMISAATYRLVEGLFDTEERGQPELKGVATPLTLYRVSKESEAHSRFAVVVRKGLMPLVGREHEFGLLRERWERVKDGTGQVVLLSGEPGIGKSRLVEALKEAVEDRGARCLELRCSPYAQNSALQPVIEHLQRTLHFQPADAPDEKLQKLEAGVQRAVPLQTEALPLLAALLSLPTARFPIPALSPQKQKEKTYEVLVAWLCAEAKHQAVTYAWEDLHWADPSTLELLTLFLQQVPTTRLLAVFTYRPEFTPPWGAHSYLSQLSLSRLGRTHVEVMVEKVTGGHALPAEIRQQIVNKTDGVPLFVEELTKSVVESVEATGRTSLHALDIPATLQDSLMARLDRLGTAKEIAQLGATLGREFTYELLKAVSPLHEYALQHGLKQLVDSELVYQSGTPPQARYLFKHALVQDTAYQSLLKSRRQQLHHQIANVLEEQFAEIKEKQPELLARHYTEAGMTEQAIPYWQQAGEKESQRSAHVEASAHFTNGLELLKTLLDTPQRTQQELTLQIALGAQLIATKGYGARDVERTYTRARELCQQLGESPQLFPVLEGLRAFYFVRAEYTPARELSEELLTLAQRFRDPALLLEAHQALGVTLTFLGEFVPAREHLEQGIALYDPRQHRSLAFLYGLDPGVGCRSHVSWALCFLGYPGQAVKRNNEALTLAQELSHTFSLVYALGTGALVYQLLQEEQAAQGLTELTISLAREQGFPQDLAQGIISQGWVLVEQGRGEDGITLMRQGLTAYRATGAEAAVSYFLAVLAEACGIVGEAEQGLATLIDAFALVEKTGERFYEAELYRLKGTLTMQSKVYNAKSKIEAEAERYFLKAIEIAQTQQAKSLELRAATSLARLWQHQGKQEEAHTMLAEVYNWFTEGFDTKDLQEAKAVLEELRP